MARAQRIEYEGALYHVTARGNERRAIFLDDADREEFLRRLAESLERFEVQLYLFCLMPNHVHLVVETPRANLGRFMHRLQTAYTMYFNRRHRRHGHLLQGRYGARLVERGPYLLRLSRYVHLNPVFTAAARRRPLRERIALLHRYPWSSYRQYLGQDQRFAFVDRGPILALVGPGTRRPAQAYRGFVEAAVEDIDADFIEAKRASSLSIGSEKFRDKIRRLHEKRLGGKPWGEGAAFRRRGTVRRVEAILATVCGALAIDRASLRRRRRDSWDRAIASRMLCQYGGLTQQQVADVLGIASGAAVSQQLRKLAEAMAADRRLRGQVLKIAAQLQSDPPDRKSVI
ncbi:MAG: transposase [Planctomycetes bacterium]|nr:transposase [Planctomycetota bacterium]